MFFTYLWQSIGLSHKDAFEKFSFILLKQCELYKEAFGEIPKLKIKQIENIFIGQLSYDPGIIGWEPWIDRDEVGIAWGGICENYLGNNFNTIELNNIWKVLRDDPQKVCSWDGMFYIIIWNKNEEKILLTTAATACPTLWYTEGPYGWAAGPRAIPILEMVDRKPVPNMGAINLFLLYEYFIGGYSPFKDVFRIGDRQQIILKVDNKPQFLMYIPIAEYLKSEQKFIDRNEIISYGARRIIHRVSSQMRNSLNPTVLLTGGKDSRAITVAAKKTGFPFITKTSGLSDSEDVILAAQVAKLLNLEHRYSGDYASIDSLIGSVDRLKLWVRISEGIIPLNYVLPFKDFLLSNLPFPVARNPVFHGLHHGLSQGYGYYMYRNKIDKLKTMTLEEAHNLRSPKSSLLKLNGQANDLLKDAFVRLDNIIHQTNGTVDQWLDLFYWKERCLIWGMDVQSVYSPVRWAWMPLYDREMIQLCWPFTPEQKLAQDFIIKIIKVMEPALAQLECTAYKQSTLINRIKAKIERERNFYLNKIGLSTSQKKSLSTIDNNYRKFWEAILLTNKESIWKEFIDEKSLDKVIRLSPRSKLLWYLATVDFLEQVYF